MESVSMFQFYHERKSIGYLQKIYHNIMIYTTFANVAKLMIS